MVEERGEKGLDEQALLKKKAAEHAVGFVESGMVLGLGSGSTFRFVLEIIGNMIKGGDLRDIVGIPSSLETERLARELGIPLTTLEEHGELDVTIDGADEVDPQLNLIKGGGGALLREKILAQFSRRNIIIVDESKMSPKLGARWAVPIEVIPFAWQAEAKFLESLGAEVELRSNGGGSPFFTDQDNYILKANFGKIDDPKALASQLDQRAAIMEHGLFIELATDVIAASAEEIVHLKKE